MKLHQNQNMLIKVDGMVKSVLTQQKQFSLYIIPQINFAGQYQLPPPFLPQLKMYPKIKRYGYNQQYKFSSAFNKCRKCTEYDNSYKPHN